MGDVTTDAVAAPTRSGHPPAVGQHLGIAVPVGAEAALAEDGLVAGHHLDGHRPLVRVHADDDPLCLFHRVSPMLDPVIEPGGQRYFELSKPLEPLLALATSGTAQAR